MFVEFLKELPGSTYKVGDVVEFPDEIARSYNATGYTKEVPAAAYFRSLLTGEVAGMKADISRAMTDAVKAVASPPAHKTEDEIRAGEAAADRGAKNIGDITRCLYLQRSDEPGAVRWATDRLEKSYGLSRSKWTDPTQVSSEQFGVSRAGTESMTGAATYGYLVPPTFIQDVFRVMSEEAVVSGTRQVPIGAGVEAKYPALDQFGTTTGGKKSNYHAGVQLYRATENQTRTPSDATLNELDFKATDLTGFTKVSRNNIADSFYPLDSFLIDIFSQAFTWRKDLDFLWGTGAGEPLGMISTANPALVAGGGVSGNAARKTASQILYDDLTWMLSKLHPNCWGGAYWIAHLSTLPFLIGIQSTAGTFVYQPNSMISQADRPSIYGPGRFQGTMLGFPVRFTEKASALGTQGDLNLVCPSMYGECQKAGLEVGLSEHFLFDTDQVAIRWKLRNDGKSLWRKYFTDYQNTTSSPFVQLV